MLRAASVIASVLILATRGASALTQFAVTTDRPPDNLQPGDFITVGIRLSGGTNVFGLGASAYGYDESVVDFESGEAVSQINNAVIIGCVGCHVLSSGLYNYLVSRAIGVFSGPLGESSIGDNGNRVLFFNGVGLSATNSNPLDPGLDNVVGGGGVQFRLVFRAIDPGRTVIRIGTGYEGDGEVSWGGSVDTSSNVEVAITVVPEPGTGLLVGLGLAGLATSAARKNPSAQLWIGPDRAKLTRVASPAADGTPLESPIRHAHARAGTGGTAGAGPVGPIRLAVRDRPCPPR